MHNDYKNRLISAIKCSDENDIKTNSSLNLLRRIPDSDIKLINELIQGYLTENMSSGIPGYWGDKCLDISANVYAFLRRWKIPCEIVFGDIELFGVRKYGTEVNELMIEHKSLKKEGKQHIHAWITLGDDLIIDGGLYDMTVSELNWTKNWNNRIIVTRAEDLSLSKGINYVPMFIGAGFLSTTNGFSPSMFFDD